MFYTCKVRGHARSACKRLTTLRAKQPEMGTVAVQTHVQHTSRVISTSPNHTTSFPPSDTCDTAPILIGNAFMIIDDDKAHEVTNIKEQVKDGISTEIVIPTQTLPVGLV